MSPTRHPIGTTLRWLLAAALGWAQAPVQAADEPAATVVNRTRLDPATVSALRQRFGQVQPGRYWYDSHTGAWGPEGGPTAGWLPPALPLPQPLRPDASGGGDGRWSGVFINGRELHPLDVAGLARLTGGPVWPGHWWVDAQGSFGLLMAGTRGPALGNLWALARQNKGGSDGPWSIASPDGKRFVGRDSDGVLSGNGLHGERWFSN